MKIYVKWMKRYLFRLVISFIIITMIAFIPSIYQYQKLFNTNVGMSFSFANYLSSIGHFFNQVLHGNLGTYGEHYYKGQIVGGREISKNILTYLRLTITIFLTGLLTGSIFGFIAGYQTLLLKQKWRNFVQTISFLFVAIPDFFIVIMLQFIVIWIYKKTGIRLFSVATGGTSTAYFLPIFTLSILPFTYVYRNTLNSFEQIISNRYILTAYSKGLSKFTILKSHVAKNGLIFILNSLPNIIMLSLSNLFIIEYLYNTHGITMFLYQYSRNINVIAVSVFLIWLMVEAILMINDLVLTKLTKYKGDHYV